MNADTPKFCFGEEKDSKKYSSDFTFYSLLLKSYENKADLLFKREAKKRLFSLNKSTKKKNNLASSKKRTKHNVSEPKGQFATFLVKRFHIRNDFDKQHTDEFLSSKEQAFEFPSKDDDTIID